MKWTLQAAKDEPMEEVFALYEKRVEWMKQRGLRQWDAGYLAVYPLSYYQMQRDAGRLYLLKDAEGRLAGAAVLLSRDGRWPDGDRVSACYVHNLVTDPDKRGSGRELLRQAEALARARGLTWMRLDCGEGSAFLNDYYEKMGYIAAGKCQEAEYRGVRREKRL